MTPPPVTGSHAISLMTTEGVVARWLTRLESTPSPLLVSPSQRGRRRQQQQQQRQPHHDRLRRSLVSQSSTTPPRHGGTALSRRAASTDASPQSTAQAVASAVPPWRPGAMLDEWVAKEARPISLKQLTFFGRTLTVDRLLSSANYIREELPIRLAHRLRDMQTLPYVVVANPNISHVYEQYYSAFETLRRVKPIVTVEDNSAFCAAISKTLQEHLTVIPSLAMGVLECQSYMTPDATDRFMNNMLRARISRRVIAQQHLALTSALNSKSGDVSKQPKETRGSSDFVGEVFLKCNAAEVVRRCAQVVSKIARQAYGEDARIPEVRLSGHLDATFPYILSHLEYIIGELLRNSFSATFEKHGDSQADMPPIEVLIVESPQHVILRFSDQGGGIPGEILPTLWSFGRGPRTQTRLKNLSHVPKMEATMQEINPAADKEEAKSSEEQATPSDSSLGGLSSRRTDLRLGMGLPMSRVYAEYWAGSLNLQNLTGYGTDAFLHISKLGNKNEQLTTRASMDAL